MLRYLVAIFLILNLLLFGWMQGWFINAPQQQGRTPERLQTQVRPDAIQITSASEPETNNHTNIPPIETPQQEPVPVLPTTPPADPRLFFCLETGPLNGEQLTQLQYMVKLVLPDSAWETSTYNIPNSWAVYLGPYADENSAFRKHQELRAMGVESNVIRGKPEFQPGITLGLYGVYSNAQNHLEQAHQRGITDARIVVWQYSPKGQLLRIKEISERQWTQLSELTRGTDLPTFTSCENEARNIPA